MKLIYEKLSPESEDGFTFKEIRTSHFSCPWHFHTELELILTLRFDGYRMVGDHLAALTPGDLVLLGSNLPHLWQVEPGRGPRTPATHILVIQFEETFLGESFWRIPATRSLRQLLKRAAVGLRFCGATREKVAGCMMEMRHCSGLRRLALFLTVLEALASSSESHPLASPGYTAELNPFYHQRMDRVFRFIHERLDQVIHLRQVARCAGLSDAAFSRCFRRHSGRTFPEYVNQARVARACRLLAETDAKIADIAFACGFTNLSNFNRQFQRIKHMTPREYAQHLRRLERQRPASRSRISTRASAGTPPSEAAG